jgi:hypothetical protein
VAAGPVVWLEAGQWAAGPGLAVLSAVALLVVPVVMLAAVTTPAAVAKTAVPRSWRAWWRRGGHWWRSGPAAHPRPAALLVRVVRAADRNRCVACGVHQSALRAAGQVLAAAGGRPRASLELDHYFPFSLGGQLILWNLFLLCPRCNVVKSNYWRDDHGHVTYRAFAGFRSTHQAAAILRREWAQRFNLFRWWRAAWAL